MTNIVKTKPNMLDYRYHLR